MKSSPRFWSKQNHMVQFLLLDHHRSWENIPPKRDPDGSEPNICRGSADESSEFRCGSDPSRGSPPGVPDGDLRWQRIPPAANRLLPPSVKPASLLRLPLSCVSLCFKGTVTGKKNQLQDGGNLLASWIKEVLLERRDDEADAPEPRRINGVHPVPRIVLNQPSAETI